MLSAVRIRKTLRSRCSSIRLNTIVAAATARSVTMSEPSSARGTIGLIRMPVRKDDAATKQFTKTACGDRRSIRPVVSRISGVARKSDNVSGDVVRTQRMAENTAAMPASSSRVGS